MAKRILSSVTAAVAAAAAHVAHAAATCPAGATTKLGGVCFASETGLPETDFKRIILVFIGWLAFMFGSIAIIVLVVCGFQYLFAAGDDSQAENAKKCVKWAVLGIIVAGLSYTIVRTLGQLLFGIPPIL